jgi:hypothetical protein
MSQALTQKERMFLAITSVSNLLIKEHFPVKFHNTKEFEFTLEKNPEQPEQYRATEITAWTNRKRKVMHSHTLTQSERSLFAALMEENMMVDAPRLQK